MLIVVSKCRQITGIFWPIGFMIASAVDLLYVLGRSFVCLPDLPHSGQFGGNHVVILCWSDRPMMWATATLNNISVFTLV